MSGGHRFHETVSKVLVRKTRLERSNAYKNILLLIKKGYRIKKRQQCGQTEHLSKHCWQLKRCYKIRKHKCLARDKPRHTARNNEENEDNEDDRMAATLAVSMILLVNPKQKHSNNRSLNSESLRHMTNQRHNFIPISCQKSSVKASNSDFIKSTWYCTVMAKIIVRGKLKKWKTHNDLFAQDLTYTFPTINWSGQNCFEVVSDTRNRSPGYGIVALLHKPSGEVKMVRADMYNELGEAITEVDFENTSFTFFENMLERHKRLTRQPRCLENWDIKFV